MSSLGFNDSACEWDEDSEFGIGIGSVAALAGRPSTSGLGGDALKDDPFSIWGMSGADRLLRLKADLNTFIEKRGTLRFEGPSCFARYDSSSEDVYGSHLEVRVGSSFFMTAVREEGIACGLDNSNE